MIQRTKLDQKCIAMCTQTTKTCQPKPIGVSFLCEIMYSHVFPGNITNDNCHYVSSHFSLYGRHIEGGAPPPPMTTDKSKKISRKR